MDVDQLMREACIKLIEEIGSRSDRVQYFQGTNLQCLQSALFRSAGFLKAADGYQPPEASSDSTSCSMTSS